RSRTADRRASPLWQRRDHLLDPRGVNVRDGAQLVACLALRLGHTRQHRRPVPILGLAGELETDAVGIVEVDAEESWQLWDRAVVGNGVALQALLDLAEPRRRHHERAVLHGADGVAIAGRLLAAGDFEEREQAVVPHIEEVVTDLLVRGI